MSLIIQKAPENFFSDAFKYLHIQTGYAKRTSFLAFPFLDIIHFTVECHDIIHADVKIKV